MEKIPLPVLLSVLGAVAAFVIFRDPLMAAGFGVFLYFVITVTGLSRGGR